LTPILALLLLQTGNDCKELYYVFEIHLQQENLSCVAMELDFGTFWSLREYLGGVIAKKRFLGRKGP